MSVRAATETELNEIVAFYVAKRPKAAGVYKNRPDQWLDDRAHLISERGDRMADLAADSGAWDSVQWIDLKDVALEYLYGDVG